MAAVIQVEAAEALFEQRTDWIGHCWHAQVPLVEVSLCRTVESFLTQPIPRLRSHTSGIWRDRGGLEGIWRRGFVGGEEFERGIRDARNFERRGCLGVVA